MDGHCSASRAHSTSECACGPSTPKTRARSRVEQSVGVVGDRGLAERVPGQRAGLLPRPGSSSIPAGCGLGRRLALWAGTRERPGRTEPVACTPMADGAAPSRLGRDLFVAGVSGVIALVTALVVALVSVLGANSIRPSVRAWKRAAKHKQMKSGSHARQKCAARMLRYTKSFGGCTRLAWHHRVHLLL